MFLKSWNDRMRSIGKRPSLSCRCLQTDTGHPSRVRPSPEFSCPRSLIVSCLYVCPSPLCNDIICRPVCRCPVGHGWPVEAIGVEPLPSPCSSEFEGRVQPNFEELVTQVLLALGEVGLARLLGVARVAERLSRNLFTREFERTVDHQVAAVGVAVRQWNSAHPSVTTQLHSRAHTQVPASEGPKSSASSSAPISGWPPPKAHFPV